MSHQAKDLIFIFNQLFESSYQTRLVGGADEPLYQPATGGGSYHEIHFRLDYFSSALHEVAHWCVAGEKRRQLVDFGYWYHPDGRSQEQQQLFEQVEAKPQAIEWIFSKAAGIYFQPSIDNLDNQVAVSPQFFGNIVTEAKALVSKELPDRIQQFAVSLRGFYQGQAFDDPSFYSLDQLS